MPVKDGIVILTAATEALLEIKGSMAEKRLTGLLSETPQNGAPTQGKKRTMNHSSTLMTLSKSIREPVEEAAIKTVTGKKKKNECYCAW